MGWIPETEELSRLQWCVHVGMETECGEHDLTVLQQLQPDREWKEIPEHHPDRVSGRE